MKKTKVKEEKLRIFAIGDLHGDSRKASQLAIRAKKENVDLVIMSGDLTYAEQSVDYLVGPFAKRKLDVLIVPGNHETNATAQFLEKAYAPYVKDLHGRSIIKKQVGIFGAGGASVGPVFSGEKEIYAALHRGFEKVKYSKKKIMVTHAHPSETFMATLTHPIIKGSTCIRRAIEQFKPDIAICSHAHEGEGIEERIGKTRLINVGKRGKIIEI